MVIMIKHKLFINNGFTLVEMLVMLAVISILATIIYGGYTAYQTNASKTQIYSTIDSYKKSLKSYSLEYRSYPKLSTCLPHNSTCCTSYVGSIGTINCGTNTELTATHNIDTTGTTGTNVSKYIHSQTPRLPVFASFTNCVPGLMSTGPCKASAAVPNVGIAYISNQPGGKYTSTESSMAGKGFLIYYVSTTFTCNSSSIMTLSGTDLVFNDSATYTRQVGSSYRECIVGLRS
ncbi:hypothetical protein A3F64_00660 [Candidatus Saccharibacteria bacterium RIFCSPHIGHO2_12_FULL_42_8]|nr:MAG: hypothetical protein A3F64_00660 [Candidatus Saccharibacteria bacterium RIFCSPHIGHO2_12_FULL_42_8]